MSNKFLYFKLLSSKAIKQMLLIILSVLPPHFNLAAMVATVVLTFIPLLASGYFLLNLAFLF